MPSSIPYDHPSLVLGNVVDLSLLNILKEIDNIQTKTDTAYDKMNSLIMMKRRLQMTLNELVNLNVDVSAIKKEIEQLDKSISAAALNYMQVSLKNETDIVEKREQINSIEPGDAVESPLDFGAIEVKSLPLSSESIKLDAQYFSYGSNKEDDIMPSIEEYVSEATDNVGPKSKEVAKTVSSQISRQKQNHNVEGTLIITASCTHKNVGMIEPCVIDVDKAIGIWNHVFEKESIDTSDYSKIKSALEQNNKSDKNNLTILSGVSYGSSFVGMVHILRTESAQTGVTDAEINQLQQKLTLGAWVENASGGFGVAPSVLDEVKKVFGSKSVSSHVSMVVMGAVPSIKSNKLTSVVNQENSQNNNSDLLDSSTGEDGKGKSPEFQAELSRKLKRKLAIQNASKKSMIDSLSKIDQETNKVLDINSMLDAFENYLQAISNKDSDSTFGVPINFYLKRISKEELLKLWVNKYYPKKDDTQTSNNQSSQQDTDNTDDYNN